MKILLILILMAPLFFTSYAQQELIEVTRPDGIATNKQLNDRVQKLEEVVRELQVRFRHLESASKGVEPLEFYICKLSPPLSKSFEKRAESKAEASARAIQACQRANRNSSLCNLRNMNCKKEER